MSASRFAGAWRLVLSEFRYDDGSVVEPYGANAGGLLIYSPDGWMSAHIMRRDRPPFETADRLAGTPEQLRAAFAGYRAYGGTYAVDEEARTVTHHAQLNLLPNEVGVALVRHYEFAGEQLVLTTPPLLIGGRWALGRLVWERAGTFESAQAAKQDT